MTRLGSLGITALLGAGLLGCEPSPSEHPIFPTYYEIKMHEGSPSSVAVRYREPGGDVVRVTVSPPWRSRIYEFSNGERIELFARAEGDPTTLLDCQITTRATDDPDGTSYTHGGLPRCHLDARAGSNPFGEGD
jgi:hypothetical protein